MSQQIESRCIKLELTENLETLKTKMKDSSSLFNRDDTNSSISSLVLGMIGYIKDSKRKEAFINDLREVNVGNLIGSTSIESIYKIGSEVF